MTDTRHPVPDLSPDPWPESPLFAPPPVIASLWLRQPEVANLFAVLEQNPEGDPVLWHALADATEDAGLPGIVRAVRRMRELGACPLRRPRTETSRPVIHHGWAWYDAAEMDELAWNDHPQSNLPRAIFRALPKPADQNGKYLRVYPTLAEAVTALAFVLLIPAVRPEEMPEAWRLDP